MMRPGVQTVAARLPVAGELVAAEPFLGGHINDSYLLTYRHDGGTTRFLLQRINGAVFPRPDLVMDNIERVTAHIARRLRTQGLPDADRRVLTLVPMHDGKPYDVDDTGSTWRLVRYIEQTRVAETVETPEQAYQAGRAFGRFQHQLVNYAGPRLHETISDFHDTPRRFEALDRAVRADPCNRAAQAKTEIAFAERHRSVVGALLDLHRRGEIPERVVHNDAKISNVLLDVTTGEGLCIVDLDTVMPGLALYDFGDMVRTMTTTAAEDEADLSKVELEMPLFEALARGYVESAGTFLTPAERTHLVTAGKLITLEQGVRFLTDFLLGDAYYRTRHPTHNLDRCRTQFRLVESITRRDAQMTRLVEHL